VYCEHSTLNRLVAGSIPAASTTLLPIFQALTAPGWSALRCVFQNLSKLLSPVALIDCNPQWFQFLVLIRLHQLQVGVPYGLAYRKGIAALFHRVGTVGCLAEYGGSTSCPVPPSSGNLEAPGNRSEMTGLRTRGWKDPALFSRPAPDSQHGFHAVAHRHEAGGIICLALRNQMRF